MKFQRIPHLYFSRKSSDDDIIDYEYKIRQKRLFITEKLDGAQLAITYDKDIGVRAWNRNTLVYQDNKNIKSDAQFKPLSRWISKHYKSLMEERFIFYGEWLYHTHTVYYDKLPDWFLLFGITDRVYEYRYDIRFAIIEAYHRKLEFIPVLDNASTILRKDLLDDFITISTFGPKKMEGIVLHEPKDDGKIFKYVTEEFINKLNESKHWSKKPRRRNKLKVIKDDLP